jgi:hypothetical protein
MCTLIYHTIAHVFNICALSGDGRRSRTGSTRLVRAPAVAGLSSWLPPPPNLIASSSLRPNPVVSDCEMEGRMEGKCTCTMRTCGKQTSWHTRTHACLCVGFGTETGPACNKTCARTHLCRFLLGAHLLVPSSYGNLLIIVIGTPHTQVIPVVQVLLFVCHVCF